MSPTIRTLITALLLSIPAMLVAKDQAAAYSEVQHLRHRWRSMAPACEGAARLRHEFGANRLAVEWKLSVDLTARLKVLETDLSAISVYQLVQHGSTAIGLSVLVVAYASWYRNTKPGAAVDESISVRCSRRGIVGVLAALPVVGGLALAAWSVQTFSGGRLVAGEVVQFAVGWITCLAMSLAVLGLFRPPGARD